MKKLIWSWVLIMAIAIAIVIPSFAATQEDYFAFSWAHASNTFLKQNLVSELRPGSIVSLGSDRYQVTLKGGGGFFFDPFCGPGLAYEFKYTVALVNGVMKFQTMTMTYGVDKSFGSSDTITHVLGTETGYFTYGADGKLQRLAFYLTNNSISVLTKAYYYDSNGALSKFVDYDYWGGVERVRTFDAQLKLTNISLFEFNGAVPPVKRTVMIEYYNEVGVIATTNVYQYNDLTQWTRLTSVNVYQGALEGNFILSTAFYNYDASGTRKTDRIVYYRNGNPNDINSINYYRYVGSAVSIRCSEFYTGGALMRYTLYSPTAADILEKGIPISEAMGVVSSGKIVAYSADNALLRATYLDANGNVLSLAVNIASRGAELPSYAYVYDASGKFTAKNNYDKAGALINYYLYQYDDSMNPNRNTSFDYYTRTAGVDAIASRYVYTYDSAGNKFLDRCIFYRNGNASDISSIYYYEYITGQAKTRLIEYFTSGVKTRWDLYRGGQVVQINYMQDGGMVTQQNNYIYIADKRLTSWVGYNCDANGNNAEKKVMYNYDGSGHLLRDDPKVLYGYGGNSSGKVTVVLKYNPVSFNSPGGEAVYLISQTVGYVNIDGVDKANKVRNYGVALIPPAPNQLGGRAMWQSVLENIVEYEYDNAGASRYITTNYSLGHITYSRTDDGKKTDYKNDATSGLDLAYQTKDLAGKLLYTYSYYMPTGTTSVQATRILDAAGKVLSEVGGVLDVQRFVLYGEAIGSGNLVYNVDSLAMNELAQKQDVIAQKGTEPTYGLAQEPTSSVLQQAKQE